MKNKHFFRNIAIILFIAASCSIVVAAAAKTGATKLLPGQLELTGKLTAKALEKTHYRKLPQDAGLSSRIFDEYFKTLDPGKVYFTRHDILSFGKDRFRLLDEINNGELRAIYAIYDRYLGRLREYRNFVEKLMQSDISFDTDESYTADRKDSD
ncbi:MAG: hypothetical protein J6Q81_00875, partial [Lentisphaeria bacterium]|nr:hypothetical protein [Lentisphaeria bacterium]